jgi:hypothetical protein
MAQDQTIRLRLLRDDPAPPSPDGSAFRFGLQDSKEGIQPGVAGKDGKLRFDFELTVKQGADPDRPVFTGPHASGPRDDRFVYLSWQRLNGQGYVNRIKARLCDIGWPLVHEAQASGKVLEADMSGRAAGGGRVPVQWRLADA